MIKTPKFQTESSVERPHPPTCCANQVPLCRVFWGCWRSQSAAGSFHQDCGRSSQGILVQETPMWSIKKEVSYLTIEDDFQNVCLDLLRTSESSKQPTIVLQSAFPSVWRMRLVLAHIMMTVTALFSPSGQSGADPGQHCHDLWEGWRETKARHSQGQLWSSTDRWGRQRGSQWAVLGVLQHEPHWGCYWSFLNRENYRAFAPHQVQIIESYNKPVILTW